MADKANYSKQSAIFPRNSLGMGVILTGMLDDGTAGLITIKKCGGVAVVQDPKDAAYPDMPQNALNNLKVDHCVVIPEMGALLDSLARERPRKQVRRRRHQGGFGLPSASERRRAGERLGPQVPYNCPNCGGVLWQVDVSGMHTCHTGHSFTAAALLTSQTERIEETLWVSLRTFEERKNLLKRSGRRLPP